MKLRLCIVLLAFVLQIDFVQYTYADVVVVVGAHSRVESLTKSQVADIYMGRAKDFPSGGTALTTVPRSGPVKDEFLAKVLGKTDSQVRATWSRLLFTGGGTVPRELDNSADVKALLSANPNVIGVIDKAEITQQVKVVFSPEN